MEEEEIMKPDFSKFIIVSLSRNRSSLVGGARSYDDACRKVVEHEVAHDEKCAIYERLQ